MILTVAPPVMPQDAVNLLNQYFGAQLNWQALERQGTSHFLYSARDSAGANWVARIRAYEQPAPAVDSVREQRILDSLSGRKWIAPVALNEPQTGLLLTPYVGEPLARSSIGPQRLAAIVEMVTELHQIETGPALDYSLMFAQYRARFEDCSPGYLQLVDEAQAMLASLPDIGTCLVHHDLHAGNLCWNPQLRVIDWEYAGVGTPWLDYATLARDLDLSWQRLAELPRLAAVSRSSLESGLAQAIEYVDRLEQIWLHYRSISSSYQTEELS